MSENYFTRVHRETSTRLWINNPSGAEIDLALAAGAISCTTNPAYCSKLIEKESAYVAGLIDQVIPEVEDDDEAADQVYMLASQRVIDAFLPIYKRSGGTAGFVTLQGDPRLDEDPDTIINAALRYRKLGPNFMTKIPVTAAGSVAIATLVGYDIPMCATEVFAIAQMTHICEAYLKASRKTGKHPPLYTTHITGIFDQYLGQVVAKQKIKIAPEVLAQAGCAVGRKEYALLKKYGYPTTMLGGGARGIQHFTEFVGGDLHITINWSTAKELIDADPPATSRIHAVTPPEVIDELMAKLPDFRKAWVDDGLTLEEFGPYGPVELFRNNFMAGTNRLVQEVKARRQARAERRTDVPVESQPAEHAPARSRSKSRKHG